MTGLGFGFWDEDIEKALLLYVVCIVCPAGNPWLPGLPKSKRKTVRLNYYINWVARQSGLFWYGVVEKVNKNWLPATATTEWVVSWYGTAAVQVIFKIGRRAQDQNLFKEGSSLRKVSFKLPNLLHRPLSSSSVVWNVWASGQASRFKY